MNRHVVVIEANQRARNYWPDLWRHRDLLYQLIWKDLLLRYRQTLVGVNWALVRPLLPMIILVLVFSKLAKLSSEGIPYPLFVLAALLPWQFITGALSASSLSLVGNAHLISKVYFPRLIIPLAALGACLVDLLISLALFFGLMVWYSFQPRLTMCYLPLFILLALGLSAGLGLWFGSLSVRHRDFIHALPMIIQFGLYISPVGYGTSLVPSHYKWLFALNPFTGIIDGFRWSLLGVEPYWPGLVVSLSVILITLTSGLWLFRQQEQTFADVI